MAYTENVQGEDGELFYNNDYAARDKYTEGQQMEKEPSEQESLDELKFFGEDEVQPKNTLDIHADQVQEGRGTGDNSNTPRQPG